MIYSDQSLIEISGERFLYKNDGFRIIKQPNDKLAVFDVDSGDFISLNNIREELKNFVGLAGLDRYDYYMKKEHHGYQPDTWEKALERIKRFKSKERLQEILQLIS